MFIGNCTAFSFSTLFAAATSLGCIISGVKVNFNPRGGGSSENSFRACTQNKKKRSWKSYEFDFSH